MAVSVSVMVTQVNEDGSEGPADGELAAALTGHIGQFSSMVAWAAEEKVIGESGRELRRRLEAAFTIDSAREERIAQVTSAAGIRHGSVEAGHDRGVVSIFGPVRASRLAYRNRREATCIRLTPGGYCLMTPTPWGCAL